MNEHKKLARYYYRQGDFSSANREYLLAHKQQDGDPQILLALGLLALWNNQTKPAINYFETVYRKSAWLARRWPFCAQIAYRMAQAYSRVDDFTRAAYWYDRAAGPWALGPFKAIRSMQIQALHLADKMAYQVSGADCSVSKFILLDPLPLVEVYLDGKGPFSFFIDTGAADVIVQSDLAKELGLSKFAEFTGSFAANKKAPVGVSVLGELRLDQLSIKHVPVHLHTLAGVDDIFQRKIHGVIGTSLLRHFYATIDYAGQQLRLALINNGSTRALAESSWSAVSIPFWLIDSHMMMARGRINELPYTLFFIDTGLANSGFLVSRDSQQAAGIKPDWSSAKTSSGGGGQLRYVDFELNKVVLGEGNNSFSKSNVKAQQHQSDQMVLQGKLGFNVAGLISHDFFKGTALTLDFEAMRLIIQ